MLVLERYPVQSDFQSSLDCCRCWYCLGNEGYVISKRVPSFQTQHALLMVKTSNSEKDTMKNNENNNFWRRFDSVTCTWYVHTDINDVNGFESTTPVNFLLDLGLKHRTITLYTYDDRQNRLKKYLFIFFSLSSSFIISPTGHHGRTLLLILSHRRKVEIVNALFSNMAKKNP